MKTNRNMSGYKHLLLIIIFVLSTVCTWAQDVSSTLIKKEIKLGASSGVELNLYDLSAVVKPSSGNEVRIELEYIADGKEEELTKLKSLLESSVLRTSGGSNAIVDLTFQKYFDLEIMGMKWKKVTIKSDKKQKINLKEFKIKRCEIWIPEKINVDLNAKYSKLDVTNNISGALNLSLYDTKSNFKELAGDVMGDLKYSQLTLASAGRIKLNLYECELTTKDSESLYLNAKYSQIRNEKTSSIDLNIYEGSFSCQSAEDVNVESKYAELNLGTVKKLDLKAYEGSCVFENAGNVHLSAKYLGLEAQKVSTLQLYEAYENEIKICEIKSLTSKDGKYNEFTIGKLEQSLVHSGYEDEIDIESLSAHFQKIEIAGKYNEVNLRMTNPQTYLLSGKLQYPDLKIPEEKYRIREKIMDDSNLEFKYEYGNVNATSPKISVSGYEIALRLEH
ncbi:MAG: hypothetical protein N4A74_18665 [Carboxylicivirga sp.]|nr:hypothetical protein [Carboxylicivirga sp.]